MTWFYEDVIVPLTRNLKGNYMPTQIPLSRSMGYKVAHTDRAAEFIGNTGIRQWPNRFLVDAGGGGKFIASVDGFGNIWKSADKIIPASWDVGLPVDPPNTEEPEIGIDLTKPIGLASGGYAGNPRYQKSTHRISVLIRNEFGGLATAWYDATTGEWVSGNGNDTSPLVNK